MRYVIDTDMGVDDWMALTYLFALPVEVAAITVSGTGLAHGPPGIANLHRLLQTLGQAGIPLAYGPDVTVGGGSNRFPEHEPWGRVATDGIADDLGSVLAPAGLPPSFDEDAAGLLVRTLQREPAHVLALGPLTNLADALRREPAIAANVQRLTIMGGAIEVAGNTPNRLAEWNIWVDPEGAERVFQDPALGGRISLVPLDLTNAVPLTSTFKGEVCAGGAEGSLSRRIVCALLDLPWITPDVEGGSYYFWDPLAAAVAADRFRSEARFLGVRVDPATGQTLATPAPAGSGVLAFSGGGVDPTGFPASFLAALAG